MNEKQPVSFPGWKSALALSNLSPVVKASHTREILSFLHHCKKSHAPATVALIKQWLAGREATANGPAHMALRWFYRTAPKADSAIGHSAERNPHISVEKEDEQSKGSRGGAPPDRASVLGTSRSTSDSRSYRQRPAWRPMEPRPAAQDLGGPDWEKALVGTLRVRGLLSRTEDTYRSWAKRFARFIAPKSPYAAAGEEVSAFLTDLAINNRASPSSQRQALNALVFLMQEAAYRLRHAV